jgi:peptidyl-prolyl cis-trans isomerase D
MATLQRIRNRAGLLVGVIGVAMLAFILTDLLSSGNSIAQRSMNEIGEIDGETITAQDFQRLLESSIQAKFPNGQATEEDRGRERELLWNTIVRDQLLTNEYNAAGITVTPDELDDLVTGARTGNLHPISRQLFGIQPGQEVNSAAIKQNLNNVLANDPQNAAVYLYYEKEINRARLKEKYDNLIKAGLYANSMMAEAYNNEQNSSLNGRYVYQTYSSISDSSIAVSDADLNRYYNKHKEEYKQEASRAMSYVVFDVVPSEGDKVAVKEEITELLKDRVVFNRRSNAYDTIAGFNNTSDDSVFVQQNSDFQFDGSFYKEGKMSTALNEVMFTNTPGFVFGPYEENGAFHISKLMEVTSRPDSVKARHILVKPINNDIVGAKAKADSLFALVNNGGDFAEIAETNSEDGSASKGGDLGYFAEGAMVLPFNNACFAGKTGDVVMVLSQFGYHIIEITDQKNFGKAVKVATVSRTIDASTATADLIYATASQFAASNKDLENFNAAANSASIQKREANNLLMNASTISGLGQARDIVRWAYNEKSNEGAVRMFDMSDKFVVAILTKVSAKGFKTVGDVSARLKSEIIKDKKAALLVETITAKVGANLDATAKALGLEVKSMTAVKMATPTIPGVGFEPTVVGTTFGLEKGVQSPAIKGNNGVFVVLVDNITVAAAASDLAGLKSTLESRVASRSTYEPFNAIKENANVVDDRSKIY